MGLDSGSHSPGALLSDSIVIACVGEGQPVSLAQSRHSRPMDPINRSAKPFCLRTPVTGRQPPAAGGVLRKLATYSLAMAASPARLKLELLPLPPPAKPPPHCGDMTCASPYPERAIATTMPWSRR